MRMLYTLVNILRFISAFSHVFPKNVVPKQVCTIIMRSAWGQDSRLDSSTRLPLINFTPTKFKEITRFACCYKNTNCHELTANFHKLFFYKVTAIVNERFIC